MRSRLAVAFISTAAVLAVAPVATADIFWDEAVDGDLSNDRLTPTPVNFGVGTHSLIANVVRGDIDYITINVPEGASFSELRLAAYDSADGTAFIAIQAGSIITELPNSPDPANLLGWVHFGTTPEHVGTDILDDIGIGDGAIGFTPPLPSGTYSFWIQQTGAITDYQFDFVIVPAPTAAAIGLAGLTLLRRRRR